MKYVNYHDMHGSILQSSFLLSEPVQIFSEHILLAVLLPLPQVKLHSLKLPHGPHVPE